MMNYVYGRSMIVMESVNDRMRLKDKIVANVAKAVKSIQELKILSSSGSLVLGNNDWQCHRLCEHLDHTLLHGLRHVTPGYWKIVAEFTHRDCVKEIKRMRHVTTDLGRGRAWLFMALNECLLESYLRCYQQNESLCEDFYVRDALVRDQDRFNVLLTVISGLENIEFRLECDVPYLDLCVYPPNSKHAGNVESTMDFDRLSMCSMESIHVSTSKPLPQAVFERGEGFSAKDKDTSSIGSDERRHSPSLDSGIHSDWNYRQRSITPIDQLSVSGPDTDAPDGQVGVEVIHLSKKGKPHKHRKKKKRFVSVTSISEPENEEKYGTPDGPVIEIPPLDDFKLTSAIMNNQNNNDPDIDLMLDNPKNDRKPSEVTGERSPGDGMENDADKVNGITANVKQPASTVINKQDDFVPNGTPIAKKNISEEKTHIKGDSKNNLKHTDIDIHKKHARHPWIHNEDEIDVTELPNKGKPGNKKINETTAVETNSKPKVGIFTKLIESKVSDIVNAGEQIENSEKSRNAIHDSTSVHNDKYLFEFGQGANEPLRNHSDLYSGDSIVEESAQNDNSKSKPAAAPKIPSIYSMGEHSDPSSDDDTESFKQNSNLPFASRSNTSTPARFSQNSTPVDNLKHSSKSSVNSDTSDKISVSSDKGMSKNSSHMTSTHSDSSLYGKVFNRSSPDFITANQNRSKSVMSHSSANEGEEETSANRMNPSRSSSRMSANESGVYRHSPVSSTDDDNLSAHTHSGTQSPSTDLEASGKVLQAKVEELIEQRKLNQFTHLTFGDDEDLEDEPRKLPTLVRDRASSLQAGEVELDNNTMLYLMLDVLKEDETIAKMFCCVQGHTEGKTTTVLFLVTMETAYILQPQPGKQKFQKLAVIPFMEIDFVSIGFNSQILHVACKNKKRHRGYWLTPGEESITMAIVECLADSMEKCESKPGRLEVDTGNTTQKTSLRKYIASECKCDIDEADVICYSLVHWEDPSSDKGSCEWDREGTLYYKSNETANILGSQTWRIAHAALRDGMLCLYHDKNDFKPQHFLSMGGGQCVGCKRDFNCDKHHAIKVILSDGSFWSIALHSEEEANSWLQGLCQAVSEGMKMNPIRSSCVPCCMVLGKQKILMCHEDLETNFIRTLGSANLHDITAVLVDEQKPCYVVLVFESEEKHVTSEKWVLYLNSEHECNRFKTELTECWKKHFKVDLPVLTLDDFSLQKKCSEMVQHLQSSRTLGKK